MKRLRHQLSELSTTWEEVPTLEELVERIHQTNQGWHLSQQLRLPSSETHDSFSILARSYRERKVRLQRLLCAHYPDDVECVLDPEAGDGSEDILSLRLRRPVGTFRDACHIPRRELEPEPTTESST
ncbi:MAG: hypothetical protein EP343_24410 [Deltaproteobacteria bacterium]|nr:MAG: hypothetical protein EP343_24410 [Deltaproteobacteria bacterium]